MSKYRGWAYAVLLLWSTTSFYATYSAWRDQLEHEVDKTFWYNLSVIFTVILLTASFIALIEGSTSIFRLGVCAAAVILFDFAMVYALVSDPRVVPPQTTTKFVLSAAIQLGVGLFATYFYFVPEKKRSKKPPHPND